MKDKIIEVLKTFSVLFCELISDIKEQLKQTPNYKWWRALIIFVGIAFSYFLFESYCTMRQHMYSQDLKIEELEGKIDMLLNSERVIVTEPVYEEEIDSTEPKVEEESLSLISTITPAEYTSMDFSYSGLSKVSKDRKKDYGQIPKKKVDIWYHKGGSVLDYAELEKEVRYVMGRMPNIKSNEHMVTLIMETFIVESNLGKDPYLASYNKGDIGLGQFRVASAKDLIKWLGYEDVVSPKVLNEVMSFYDRELSLKDNLYKNVHFTIAMAIQEYWRKVPELNDMDLSHIGDRGILYKSVYNTKLGKGTVEKYVTRVNEFYKIYKIEVSNKEIVLYQEK